jgi:hypothetical protein
MDMGQEYIYVDLCILKFVVKNSNLASIHILQPWGNLDNIDDYHKYHVLENPITNAKTTSIVLFAVP